MQLSLDWISLLSLLASINLVYVVVLAWLEGKNLLAVRLFAALGIAGAWWAMWLGLAFTPLGLAEPRLLQASQLLSGLFGPLMLLFTLAYTGVITRWRWRYAWLILPGLAGTASFLALLVLDPEPYRIAARAFLAREVGFDLALATAGMPWYRPLQTLHAIQLLAFNVASVVVFLVVGRRAERRGERREAWFMALIFTTSLGGIVLTNVLPGQGFSADWPRAAPLLPLPFILVLWAFLRRRIATAERLAKERELLVTYLPVDAVDAVLGDGPAAQIGKKVTAAVLFSDLRGFTALSQRVDPTELVAWIDRFFERMSAAVLAEGGMVDKLIGDAVLAVFGVPRPLDDACGAAVRAARAMHAVLAELNAEHPLGGAPIEMAIGIHVGPVVAGSVGGRMRRTYTVFGDTVNVANRLERVAKAQGVELVVSAAVWDELDDATRDAFAPLGPQWLRGRDEAVEVYGAAADGQVLAAPLGAPA